MKCGKHLSSQVCSDGARQVAGTTPKTFSLSYHDVVLTQKRLTESPNPTCSTQDDVDTGNSGSSQPEAEAGTAPQPHTHLHTLHIDPGAHELPPDEVGFAVPTGDGVHDLCLQAVLVFSHLHFSQGTEQGMEQRET